MKKKVRDDKKKEWKELVSALNKQSASEMYRLIKLSSDEWGIERGKKDLVCRIKRNSMWSNDRFAFCTGYALKIVTDDDDIGNNRLKRDFGHRHLVGKLLSECDKIICELKKSKEEHEKKDKYFNGIKKDWENKYGKKIEYQEYYEYEGDYGNKRPEIGVIIFGVYFLIYINTSDDYSSVSYNLKGIDKIFTFEEVCAVIEFIGKEL